MANTTWIFGYGSLIWQPGFQPEARLRAQLSGWHRSFCMRSLHYRGTASAPGLVLALDALPGAVCHGVALAVPEADKAAVLAKLRQRELTASAYVERRLPLRLEDGRAVAAITYVIDRAHPLYCGLSLAEQAEIIARAAGERGSNAEYLFNTAAHLAALGLADADLDRLATRVRKLLG
ncbi:gamma-glutamylcyclotransferase [Phaeovulum sp.]|uniref:gamma-glutamylcyclotransferase n=1 Tax=Phaeovulum sp. TaxID=2934796 RepID=UPI00273009D4|nr:gamma-glutamylcyclotransferase [Phaeovulum sp.]MDP1668421.1 gamma-glutamylcyclotransferase [Phaeovulum sp.]MDZ4120235.1 gamma-glutamylcyclotransferase [Phaeovulum sp.]